MIVLLKFIYTLLLKLLRKGWFLFFIVIAFALWQWYREGGVGAVIFMGLVLLILWFWIRNSNQAGDSKGESEDNLVAEIHYKKGKDLVVLKKYEGRTYKQNDTDEYESKKKNSNMWEDLERQSWENGWEDDERRKQK